MVESSSTRAEQCSVTKDFRSYTIKHVDISNKMRTIKERHDQKKKRTDISASEFFIAMMLDICSK
jgi:hypothetical protein